MSNRNTENKPIVAVSIALIFVLLLVIGLFAFGRPDAAHADISLPDPQSETVTDKTDTELSDNSLLQVTPENAAVALESLWKPEYYHQVYSISVGEGASATQYSVELWINGNARRAEIKFAQDTKVILANDSEVYIWYVSDERPVHMELSADVTYEDILGLPAFDYLQTFYSLDVTDAEYLVIDEEQQEIPCIFFALEEMHGATSRYWIDLKTGLLYMADCVEGNDQVYRVEQVIFDRLANGDESFEDKFLLPDGREVFTEETKMQPQQ